MYRLASEKKISAAAHIKKSDAIRKQVEFSNAFDIHKKIKKRMAWVLITLNMYK